MEFKQQEHYQRRCLETPAGMPPEQSHGYKHGSFHKHPAKTVVDRRTPSSGVRNAITRLHIMKGNEHHNSRDGHHGKKNIEVECVRKHDNVIYPQR